MRRLLLATLATVFSLQTPCLAAGVVSRAVPIRSAPLVQLGGLLQAALPQLSALEGAQPRLLNAAAMDTGRAEVLIRKMQEPEGNPTAKPLDEKNQQVSAVGLLGAVNSVLRDFTPDELKKMPVEDLHTLASVVLDQAGRRQAGPVDEGLSIISEKRLEMILGKRGKPGREILHNPGRNDVTPSIVSSYRVPEELKLLWAEETVFRHYTTEEGMAEILKSSRLQNGFLPYVQFIPSVMRKSFAELSGVFLTRPSVKGDAVGVPVGLGYKAYVDILVPGGFPILELESGAIYLLPLPGRTFDWVKDVYNRWMRSGNISSAHVQMAQEMDADGGPGPELSVPIRIVGHGVVR